MKIIYISNARIPTEKAHGYQICQMCEEFSALGAEVELWLPGRSNGLAEDAFSYYGIKNNFQIKTIKSFDFYDYWRYLGKLSFWLQSFFFLLRLALIRADKSAVIYTRDPEIGALFSLRGYRAVYEAHTWPEKRVWLYKFLIGKIKKIIVISRGLAAVFIGAGFSRDNILVAPDGVDLKKFSLEISRQSAREKLNLPADKNIILYTGHLYEWKGADDLAQAAGLLGAGCLTVFVGGVVSDAAKFKEKNKPLIESGKIAVFPHQRHDGIPLWLKAADVLILPNRSKESISRYFTSPLKLFEYLAAGRPIVATALPSLAEALNKDNCLFCRPDNPRDLADKISLVLKDQALAEKIAVRAAQDGKKYGWEKRAEKILNFIIWPT